MTYEEMFKLAKEKINPVKLNKHCKISDTFCVLETVNGNQYTGVSLVATCGLGHCSEQAAITQMLNHDETEIRQILTLDKFGNLLPPCGRCLELITQINPKNVSAAVFVAENRAMTIKELYPLDWKKVKEDGLRKLGIKNDESEKKLA